MDENNAQQDLQVQKMSYRVKVFIFFADQWREKGIGQLNLTKIENDEKAYKIYDEYYKNKLKEDMNILPIFKLTVKSQNDKLERLISSYISSSIDYSLQDESILAWKDGDNEKAISFENKQECYEIYETIEKIRKYIEERINDIESDDNLRNMIELLHENSTEDSKSDNEWNITSGDEKELTNELVLNDSHEMNYPEITADTLEEWIQITSLSISSMNNLIGNFGTNLLNRSNNLINNEVSQLYMHFVEKDCINDFINLFNESESKDDLIVLFNLFKIFINLISTDSHDIFRLLFENVKSIIDIIGILEYDSTQDIRIEHRKYLKNKAKFRKFFLLEDSITRKYPLLNSSSINNTKETLEMTSEEVSDKDEFKNGEINNKEELDEKRLTTLESICEKASIIYHIQYIIDHIMPAPSIFDDKLGPLNTFVNHHKADLCNLIYDNTSLLNNLFMFLTKQKNNECVEEYIDAVLFLHEFCLLSNSLNPSDKDFFYNWLESYNLLQIISLLTNENDYKVCIKVIDIVNFLIEYKVSTIRDFILKQYEEKEKTCLLINLFNIILKFSLYPISNQCLVIINSIMDFDPLNLLETSNIEKMGIFYDNFFTYSFTNIIELVINKINVNNMYLKDNLLIMDKFFTFLTRWSNLNNDIFIKNIVKTNIFKFIKTLLSIESSNKISWIICGIIRFVRKLVSLKNDLINIEIIKYEILFKICDIFKNVCLNINNMLNNTIVELFHFILIDDLDVFYMPLVDKYRETFMLIDYIDFFKRLIARHDIGLNKSSGGVSLSINSPTNNSAFSNSFSIRKRKSCEFESSEEKWFNSEDDESLNSSFDGVSNLLDSACMNTNSINSSLNDLPHQLKKTKTENNKDDENNTTLNESNNTKNDDDSFEIFNTQFDKKKKDLVEDDLLDNIANNLLTTIKPKKTLNLIKIHTNKLNSSRNLVMASDDKILDNKIIDEKDKVN